MAQSYTQCVRKSDLDVFLKCSLCAGFLRNAHTINECMCSFCKSCIYRYFWTDPKRDKCPKCKDASLGGKPLKNVVSDQTLQKIVDLVYPQFKEEDLQTIKEMYQTFADAGEPLPKDTELIDYGFDFESIVAKKQ